MVTSIPGHGSLRTDRISTEGVADRWDCAPTVPRKLWDAVQEITSAAAEHKHMHSSTKHPRRIKSVYLLSGILRCARCGGMLNGMSSPQPHGQPYRRYNCATAKIKKTCAIKPIPAKLAEQIVLDSVHKFLENPQSIIDLFTEMQKHNQTASAQVDEERASLTAQLAPVRKKITNLTNAIAEKPHTRALLQKLESLETEEQQILQKLSDLKTRNITPVIIPTPQQAANAAHHIQTQLKSKDPETIRQTLLGLIHQITIDRIGKQIIGKITFHTKK